MTTQAALALARAGDDEAFRALTEPHRRELQVHCYRILGSLQDAEDAVQETLLSAWRGLPGFEERASLRAWLYRIATNRCLNALRDSGRRQRLMEATGGVSDAPEPSRRPEPIWLQPFPDELLEGLPDRAAGPDARYETKEAVGLAFVSGLQRMPPRQRAVLVLRDVLGFRAVEVAAMLETSEASVNSALQRARVGLEAAPERGPGGTVPESPAQRRLLDRFAEAMEAGEIDTVVELLAEDAWIRMPPEPLEYNGRPAIGAFMRSRPLWRDGAGGGPRLVPVRANNQPAFAYYLPDPQADVWRIGGLFVLTLAEEEIAAITRFGEGGWLPWFGLPRTLPGRPG
ncbi:MAG TPA: sigma-70 family RNA polymerase sigma factor [Solirubrobacterales bacterium]|nr:sigma-70 family RNA polymerase sigma factor [Solirubrobacterales bacterium]